MIPFRVLSKDLSVASRKTPDAGHAEPFSRLRTDAFGPVDSRYRMAFVRLMTVTREAPREIGFRLTLSGLSMKCFTTSMPSYPTCVVSLGWSGRNLGCSVRTRRSLRGVDPPVRSLGRSPCGTFGPVDSRCRMAFVRLMTVTREAPREIGFRLTLSGLSMKCFTTSMPSYPTCVVSLGWSGRNLGCSVRTRRSLRGVDPPVRSLGRSPVYEPPSDPLPRRRTADDR